MANRNDLARQLRRRNVPTKWTRRRGVPADPAPFLLPPSWLDPSGATLPDVLAAFLLPLRRRQVRRGR